MDHRYNNPVSIVFTDLLIFQLRLFRLNCRRRQRALLRGPSLESRSGPNPGDSTPPPLACAHPVSPARLRWWVAMLRALDCRRRMRNKWRLAKLLFFNPGLRTYRGHAIAAGRMQRQREREAEAVEQEQVQKGCSALGVGPSARRRSAMGAVVCKTLLLGRTRSTLHHLSCWSRCQTSEGQLV